MPESKTAQYNKTYREKKKAEGKKLVTVSVWVDEPFSDTAKKLLRIAAKEVEEMGDSSHPSTQSLGNLACPFCNPSLGEE